MDILYRPLANINSNPVVIPSARVAERFDLVKEVNREHPHLLQHNTPSSCAEFIQRVVKRINERFPNDAAGLLSKPAPGQPVPAGFTFPNGQKMGLDVIAYRGGPRIDIIQGSDNHPIPGGPAWIDIPEINPDSGINQWRSSDVYTDVSGWPIFPSDAPTGPVEAKRAQLGRVWMPALRAFEEWPQEANENYAFIMGEEDPDFLSIMADVEGRMHAGHVGIDPWRDAGVDHRQAWWADRLKKTADMVGADGKKLLICMFGGAPLGNDATRRYFDSFANAMQGRWGAVLGIRMVNEFNANGWEVRQVQNVAGEIRSRIPVGVELSLSSPALTHTASPNATNEEMQDSYEDLLGPKGSSHFGATFVDNHKLRDRASKWGSQFSYNSMTDLKQGDDEPFGQGASTGGDVSDTNLILEDYQRCSEAGWWYYAAFNAWGFGNGHFPAEWILEMRNRHGAAYAAMHQQRFIKDMPNQKAVSNGLREYRKEGTIPGTIPIPAPTSHTGKLLSGQSLLPEQTLISPGGQAHLRYQGDGNLVVSLDGNPVWSTNTSGRSAGSLQMQLDGNLVLYDAVSPIRSTRTGGHPGAMVQLQDDGNFVVYEDPNGSKAGTPLWASNSNPFFS